MNKKHLTGNLYSVDFFNYLEKDGERLFYSRREIINAIKTAINDNIANSPTLPMAIPTGEFNKD